jgi:hypothetical protein
MKALLFALTIFVTHAHAQNRFDGNWWNDTDDVSRGYYLIGYMQGTSSTAMVAPVMVCLAQELTGETLTQCLSKGQKVMDEKFVTPAAGRPYGQFADGVTAFYKDYKNRGICFSAALRFVSSEINGMNRNELDTFLERLRKNPVTGQC